MRRVTITDAGVSASSVILGTIIRPTTTDAADPGYVYTTNVISRGSGTFDVLVYCTIWGSEYDVELNPPNETVIYAYVIG